LHRKRRRAPPVREMTGATFELKGGSRLDRSAGRVWRGRRVVLACVVGDAEGGARSARARGLTRGLEPQLTCGGCDEPPLAMPEWTGPAVGEEGTSAQVQGTLRNQLTAGVFPRPVRGTYVRFVTTLRPIRSTVA
jgi:hypothetical protein